MICPKSAWPRPGSVSYFCSIDCPEDSTRPGGLGRVTTTDGGRGFQPTDPEPRTNVASRSEIGGVVCRRPWVETHGYHHSVATRRVAAYYPRNKTQPFDPRQFPSDQIDFAQTSPTLPFPFAAEYFHCWTGQVDVPVFGPIQLEVAAG